MTIIYACICRSKDAAILTEVCDRDVKGTVGQVVVELMQHLRDHPEVFNDGDLKTLVQRNEAENDFFSHFLEACSAALGDETSDNVAEHYFHLYFRDGIFYNCLSDDPDTRDQKVNFAFLQHIQQEFVKMHRKGRIKTCNAYALDKSFAPTMRSAMHYHNIHHKEIRQEERVTQMLAQVQDMRDVMGRNINMLLQRGERFDGLLDMSEALNRNAQVFKKDANTTKAIMRRRYYFCYAVLGGTILVFLYVCMVSVCGFTLSRCRAQDTDGGGGGGGGGGDGGGEGGN